MSDFLLELRSEEIPARMQVKAKADLARLFAEEIGKAGLVADAIETFATPRRLALIARGLPDATDAVREETKGPKTSAPPQALDGFLRKTGLTRDQLVEREGVFFAVIDKPGRATVDVLAEAIPAIVRAFPWPKSMRWGAASSSTESLRWVRPLQGIVALFGEDIVPCAVDGIEAGAATVGHRFHHPGAITIGGAHDYVEKLRACHVIVHLSERKKLIREGAAATARAAGLTLVEDEELVVENAGLTEWPVPLLGRFSPAFLDVPREVIQLTMRTNQKYFACVDAGGALANAFVCTANIDASDGGAAIVAGNERVLSARLSDAKFFWENDLKVPLAEQAAKLGQIVFHEKLGTVADKVERVAKLARWLCEERIVAGDADLAERAARLCKADLVTGMVGEFPELQGIIGGHLARAQGEHPAVADAIRDHYKPVGQGDDVPTDPVTVAVSLADKLDIFVSFFGINEQPTGSRDPFALRRASLGLLALIQQNGLRFRVSEMWEAYWSMFQSICRDRGLFPIRLQMQLDDDGQTVVEPHLIGSLETYEGPFDNEIYVVGDDKLLSREKLSWDEAMQLAYWWLPNPIIFPENLIHFLADRLKVQQREAGVRHDLIDAVFALGGEDDLVRLLARVRALQGSVETPEGADLLAGYKRAANILKKEGWEGSRTPGQARGDEAIEETALIAALDTAEPRAAAAIDAEDFEGAMSALASLRAPIDAFFENVTVNDADPAKRTNRLALLARFRDAVDRVADFSRIEG